MPPQLAAIVTYAFILWLFVKDIQEKPKITSALWLPVLWFVIMASRHPSSWMTLWGVPGFGMHGPEEGSALDASIYLLLILIGAKVLLSRRFDFSGFAREHLWLVLFLAYCLLATSWADSPFVAFKRWIKILGHPVMALVIFTEPDPLEATKRFIRRSAYILIPISILWIKYFPSLGRRGGGWVTDLSNNGIATGKNMLGANCFVLGLFLLWFLMQLWPRRRKGTWSFELKVVFALFLMNAWCLWQADSLTSTFALLVGGLVMALLRNPGIMDRRIGIYTGLLASLVVIAEVGFNVGSAINRWRGKTDTVEGRERLWTTLLNMDTNPIVGTGFESFWIGERLALIWEMPQFAFWKPNEAHNGYLEIYLTLGVVGLVILAALFWQIYRKGVRNLGYNREWGRLEIAALFALLVYNWMEAAIRGLSLGFFLLFYIAVSYSYSSTRNRVLRGTGTGTGGTHH